MGELIVWDCPPPHMKCYQSLLCSPETLIMYIDLPVNCCVRPICQVWDMPCTVSVYCIKPQLPGECEQTLMQLTHNVRQLVITSLPSYFHEARDGLEPETGFIYELEVPSDFKPTPCDGEVSEFNLWTVEKVYAIRSYVGLQTGPSLRCSVVHLKALLTSVHSQKRCIMCHKFLSSAVEPLNNERVVLSCSFGKNIMSIWLWGCPLLGCVCPLWDHNFGGS